MRAFVLFLSGISAVAFAGWRTTTMGGTPTDINIADAGVFAVSAAGAGATNTLFGCDNTGACTATATLAGTAQSAWSPAPGCLSVAQALLVRQTCPAGGTQSIGSTGSAIRVRATSSTRAYIPLFTTGGAPANISMSPTGGAVNDWALLSSPTLGIPSGAAMSALRVGTTDWAALAAGASAMVVQNGGTPVLLDTFGRPTDIGLYARGTTPSGLFVVGSNILSIPDLTAPLVGQVITPVPAAAGTNNTITFDWNDGSAAGRGFGMLTGTSDMWGATPSPSTPGTNWEVRLGPGWPINELKRVACFGARFCVAIRNLSGAPNVAWYFNESAPTLLSLSSVTVPEGSSVTMPALIDDNDGDPVFVTWSIGALNGAALTAAPVAGIPSNSDLQVTTTDAGTFCSATTVVTVTPTLADGLSLHDTVGTAATVTVQRTRVPGTPGLPAGPLTLNSDAGTLAVTATTPAVGCPPTAYQWSLSSAAMSAGIGIIQNGTSTAELKPPANFCGTTAGPYAIYVTGTDAVGTSRDAGVNVQIERTTPPNSPAVAPTMAVINSTDGGVVFTASPNAMGCPPNRYAWSLSSGAASLGFSLISDGGATALVSPPGGFCGVTAGPVTVDVAAADNVGASALSSSNITLVRTTPPGTPGVSPTAVTLGAPGVGVDVTASAGVGCAPQSYAWVLNDPFGAGATVFVDGGPVARLLPPVSFCGIDGGAATASLEVKAVDAVGPSTLAASVTVTIAPNGLPGAPVVTPPQVALIPGGVPASVSAAFSGNGCAGQALFWNLGNGADAGLLFTVDGGVLTVVPPAFYCSPTPGHFDVSVQATNNVDASVPTLVPITLAPWGPPLAPSFVDGMRVAQDAGTTRTYVLSSPEHACETTLGFPGVDTAWTFDPGLTGAALIADAGLATVIAPDCVSGTATLTAQRSLGGASSAPATLTVDIGTDLPPIGADAGLSVTSMAVPGSGVGGTIDYSGFRCENLRDVVVRIDVTPKSGGAVIASGDFTRGDWSLPIAGGCNGGIFSGVAALWNNGQPTGTQVALSDVSLPRVSAVVGFLREEQLAVTCGEGLVATVELLPDANGCRATETTWVKVSGPALAQDVLHGSSMHVKSAVQENLEELVGQDLVWNVTVDAGSGNVAQSQRTVHLTTAPFITIGHQAERVRVAEGDVLGVRATLVNSSACGVRSVMLSESLASLSYLEGSARVDGRSVPASVDGGVLLIGPLTVEGHGSTQVTWLGGVPLAPRIVFSAQAQLHGEQISVDVASEPVSARSCGCSSGGGALSFLALFAVWGCRRRSARRERRVELT
ncbi:MAG: hypothetical protein K1X64_13360 [Myxococcaceae bacterium]|nr:hypothetical protein [Myxococcaceae bacterium]